MRTTIRLTLKQHRFGIIGFGLILLAFVIGVTAIAGYLTSLGVAACEHDTGPACRVAWQRAGAVGVPANLLRAAALPVVVLAGVFLGVPIVATEVERGTAILPWILARSRVRWLLARVCTIGAVLALPATAVGLALDALQQSTTTVPIGASLADYEGRGWLVPARALVGFAAGVLAGSVLGRTLPGLLAGLVVATSLVLGVVVVGDIWNRADQTVLSDDRGGRVLGLGLRDRVSGQILTYAEAEAIVPSDDQAFGERFQEVWLGIPGSQSSWVVGREVALHGIEVVVLLAASAFVVDRRRPY
ncbi:MAG TPA: hypothetical protein VNO86_08210 [Candidatus Binatia bacterium]|nr:hypothetical protein [Candidatus Binatia bacterium]